MFSFSRQMREFLGCFSFLELLWDFLAFKAGTLNLTCFLYLYIDVPVDKKYGTPTMHSD